MKNKLKIKVIASKVVSLGKHIDWIIFPDKQTDEDKHLLTLRDALVEAGLHDKTISAGVIAYDALSALHHIMFQPQFHPELNEKLSPCVMKGKHDEPSS